MSSARTYLDWNATAPLCPEAHTAVVQSLDAGGNPSSVHAEGRRARAIVETAREQVAALVGARPSEVVFTSGATEACNMAIAGPWNAILVAGIEHDAVLKPAEAARTSHVKLDVTSLGVVETASASAQIHPSLQAGQPGQTLVALQLANNETGVIQPVAEFANIAHECGALLFSDAAQAAGRIPVDFEALGIDLMALSAHKLGGPKGIGALIVRDGVDLPALVKGGGQERRRRGGTENIPGIAGFGAAAAAAQRTVAERGRIAQKRDRLEASLLEMTPNAQIIGADTKRLPNTTCVALPGQSAETLVIRFDMAGIAISAGAACSAGKIGTSHALLAMGLPEAIARAAVRISIGPTTTDQEIDSFIRAWREITASRSVRTAA